MNFRYFQKENSQALAASDDGAKELLSKGYIEITEAEALASWPEKSLSMLRKLAAAARALDER